MPKDKKVDRKKQFIRICNFIYQRLSQFYEWTAPWLEKWVQAILFFMIKSYQRFQTFYITTLTRIIDYMIKTGYENRRQNYIKQSYHMRTDMKLHNRREGKFLNRLKRAQLRYYKRYLKQGRRYPNQCMRKFLISVKFNKIKVKLKTGWMIYLFKLKKVYKKFRPYDVY